MYKSIGPEKVADSSVSTKLTLEILEEVEDAVECHQHDASSRAKPHQPWPNAPANVHQEGQHEYMAVAMCSEHLIRAITLCDAHVVCKAGKKDQYTSYTNRKKNNRAETRTRLLYRKGRQPEASLEHARRIRPFSFLSRGGSSNNSSRRSVQVDKMQIDNRMEKNSATRRGLFDTACMG